MERSSDRLIGRSSHVLARGAVAALASLCLALPAAAQTKLEVPFTQFTLPNGLHVILHEDHTVPVVTLNVWYHAGSGREKPGRTGFAHLFEHLMFEGSGHVKEGAFDTLLEAAGASNNGSTDRDRTNYFIDMPANALELALFLESDRMGYLLDAMTPERVNGQRDVVKNERRQNYENAPYGMASIVIDEMLYPHGHPYRWPTIGSMDDLSAASYQDVVEFFKTYYAPGNASLVIAGDIDPARARALVEQWFGDVKPGATAVAPIEHPPAVLNEVKRKTIQDRVQLPRLYLTWLTPPHMKPGDAELDAAASILTSGKNSRLYKRLVYELQIAQDVIAYQASNALGSQFHVVVTARPPATGTSAQAAVDRIRTIVDEEIARLQKEPPAAREFERAINKIEASFYNRMERIGGFYGVGDLLNAYYFATGNPDYFNEDLSRYRALAPADVQAAAARWLPLDRRVELVVEPGTGKDGNAEGQKDGKDPIFEEIVGRPERSDGGKPEGRPRAEGARERAGVPASAGRGENASDQLRRGLAVARMRTGARRRRAPRAPKEEVQR